MQIIHRTWRRRHSIVNSSAGFAPNITVIGNSRLVRLLLNPKPQFSPLPIASDHQQQLRLPRTIPAVYLRFIATVTRPNDYWTESPYTFSFIFLRGFVGKLNWYFQINVPVDASIANIASPVPNGTMGVTNIHLC